MKYDILKQLKDAQGYVSGEALAGSVTRAALWKHIKAMEADGARIEGVTGKGYRLISPPEVPRAEYVKAYISADAEVFYKDSTLSTNDDAKRAAADKSIKRAVFIASEQTAGRGRKGRVWVSPAGGLYMTFLVRPDIEAESVPGITLMAAVKTCEAIESVSQLKAEIKWPNDVLISGRKLAGILTESMIGMDGVDYIVCGVGVNVLPPEGEFKNTACHIAVGRMLLAAAITDSFFEGCDEFERGGLSPFMNDFRNRSMLSGEVTVSSPAGSETGTFLGFDDSGALLIDCSGKKKRFVAGEVTLRGGGIYV